MGGETRVDKASMAGAPMNKYMGLFEYTATDVCFDGVVHFQGVKLLKRFPGKYEGLMEHLCVALNAMDGTVFMYSDADVDIEHVSESVSLSDWVALKPLMRTDSVCHQFFQALSG